MNWAPIRARRNLFSHFNKGKDYFYIRLGVEAAMMLYIAVQAYIIVNHALGIYPTLVRDAKSQVYLGTPSAYVTTPDEMVQLTASTLETLYLRTEKGSVDSLVAPFIAKPIRETVAASKPNNTSKGYTQTAMLTQIVPYLANAVKYGAYVQLEFELNTFDRSYLDVGYFNVLFVRTADSRTKENPAGWVMVGLLEIPKDFFLREQKRLFPNAETDAKAEQHMLDFTY